MATSERQNNGHTNLALEGEMTIYRAAEIRQQLLPLFDGAQAIEVDLSRISVIDASGLQLMLAAKLESIVRDVPLSFTGHSIAVQEVFDLCDIGGFFGDPVIISSNQD